MPRLGKRIVDAARPTGRDTVLWDRDLKGFGLRVKPSGAKSWIVAYRTRAGGEPRKMTLAKIGVLTPEEARAEAKKVLGRVAHGQDPARERKDARHDLTVSDLCDVYLKEGPVARPRKKPASWAIDQSIIVRHIQPLLGRRTLRTLVRADMERFQHDVTEGKTAVDVRTKPRGRARVTGGLGAGARSTGTLSAILSFAVSRGMRPDNPAKGVRLNELRRRERFLTTEELARLGEALMVAEREGLNPRMVDAIRLLLLTGARKNEVLGLQWDWIRFERSELRLPESKTGAKTVPLGAPALKLLANIKRVDGSPWVFPAGRGDGHLTGLRAGWKRIASAAGLRDVRLHDLRHGFASVAVADGSSLYLVGKVLGHSQARTTERYAHVGADPMRVVADRTSRKIDAALRGRGDDTKVVRLKRRRSREAGTI
jgi:integrase